MQVPVSFSGDTQMTLDAVPPVEPILELKTDKGKEGLVTAEDEGKEEVEDMGGIWGGYGGDMGEDGGRWGKMGEDGGKMGEDGGRWGKMGEKWGKMGKDGENGEKWRIGGTGREKNIYI